MANEQPNLTPEQMQALFKVCLINAEKGDEKAMHFVASAYFTGEGVEKNNEQAFKWWQKLADKGNADGQYALGICYFDGIGVEKNTDMAAKYITLAANQGHEKAINFAEKAKAHYEKMQKEKSKKSTSNTAKKSTAKSTSTAKKPTTKSTAKSGLEGQLGNSQITSENQAKSKTTSTKKPSVNILDYLSVKSGQYIDGALFKKREKEFFEHFEIVKEKAEQGDAIAQKELGDIYIKDTFIPQDLQKSQYWYNKAIENGNPEGYLGLCYFREPYYMPKDNAQLQEYMKKAVKGGVKIKKYLQMLLENKLIVGNAELDEIEKINDIDLYAIVGTVGESAIQDMNVAALCSTLACTVYPGYYLTIISLIYKDGKPYDEQTIKYLISAAGQGVLTAMFILGKLYIEGTEKIKKDPYKGVNWLKLAANYNLPVANKWLAIAFADEKVVAEKDSGRAYDYMSMAASLGDTEAKGYIEQIKKNKK
ncbi:MAG: sel1 repeat family protein [Clostridia bacterium]|nr:sel1 repeat family protein [Clostridia bacterium]